MKYRFVGNSGLQVSEISIGTWLTYGLGVDKQLAFKCLNTALENGINFIDTADVYNRGESEKVIGEYLKTINRNEVIIGTKVFGPMTDHFMQQGLSHRHILNACENSLNRLNIEHIDLYQCHRYDIDTPLEETCYAMHLLIEMGYVNYWGVSQWSAVQIINAIRICEKHNWRKPVSNQPIYNLLNRSLEVDVMDVCEKEGLGLVVYSPLAQGLLTGKYAKNKIPENSRAANEQMSKFFPFKRLTDNFNDQIEKLTVLSKKIKLSMTQLSLAWILSKKPISCAIIGASKPEQVLENIKAVEVNLLQEIMDEIEFVLQNAPADQYTGERIGYGIVKRGY